MTMANLELAKRWFEELWSKPDLDVADEIVDPDYAPDWIRMGAKGPEQVKHEIRYFRSIFPDLKYEIVDLDQPYPRIASPGDPSPRLYDEIDKISDFGRVTCFGSGPTHSILQNKI